MLSFRLIALLSASIFAAACGGEKPDVSSADTASHSSSSDLTSVDTEFGDSASGTDTADSRSMPDSPGDDADTRLGREAGEVDADSSSTDVDADASSVADGFGHISGECGVLDSELTAESSHYFENRIDFGTNPYDSSDRNRLTEGGQQILSAGNAGGSSILSEVFSFEILHRCEKATLLETEAEISYATSEGPKTDLLVKIGEMNIGTSVTRAMTYPSDAPYPVDKARSLLKDKLEDAEAARNRAADEDSWKKSVLHVIALSSRHEEAVQKAYEDLSGDVRRDTIVIVSTTGGDDDFLY